MQRCEVTLLEVRLENGGAVGGRMECPPAMRPAPGQYLLAHAPDLEEALPTALFAARAYSLTVDGELSQGALELAPPLPPRWMAGSRLALRGPLGHGFTLPPGARRVALVETGAFAQRLLPLADRALAQGAAVTLYARAVPALLPPELEVLPLDGLPDALAWADFFAVDLAPSGWNALRKRFGLAPHTPLPVPAQVLVQAPMPCGGVGECGLCAVPTSTRGGRRRAWKLACKDGPVFDFNELEEG